MKVSDLQRLCEDYLRHNPDAEVMICDDGMISKYYKAEFAIGSQFTREIKPAKTEMREQYVKIKIPDTNELKKAGLLAMSCKHNCNECGINGKCIETKGRKMKVPVQIEPPEYKEENIFMIITDLTQEEK